MAGVARASAAADVATFDLAKQPLRELNQFLHHGLGATKKVRVLNPDGAHNIAAGVNAQVEVDVDGHAGYYAAGMNQHAKVLIRGNAGPGVAEGMTSGVVHVKGFASVSAGAAAEETTGGAWAKPSKDAASSRKGWSRIGFNRKWLGGRDSNPDTRLQRPQSYR